MTAKRLRSLKSWFKTHERVAARSALALPLVVLVWLVHLHWSGFAGGKSPVEVAFYVVSIVAATLATWNYRRNAQTRRAEWLFTLYQKFFEEAPHKRIRRMLDYSADPDVQKLGSCLDGSAPDRDLEEELVDYLNFFEFVAGLQHSGQLTLDEVDQLFNYYLGNLLNERSGLVRGYVREQGFEQLSTLLDKMETEGRFRKPKAR
jgi:hypothetical protein